MGTEYNHVVVNGNVSDSQILTAIQLAIPAYRGRNVDDAFAVTHRIRDDICAIGVVQTDGSEWLDSSTVRHRINQGFPSLSGDVLFLYDITQAFCDVGIRATFCSETDRAEFGYLISFNAPPRGVWMDERKSVLLEDGRVSQISFDDAQVRYATWLGEVIGEEPAVDCPYINWFDEWFWNDLAKNYSTSPQLAPQRIVKNGKRLSVPESVDATSFWRDVMFLPSP